VDCDLGWRQDRSAVSKAGWPTGSLFCRESWRHHQDLGILQSARIVERV